MDQAIGALGESRQIDEVYCPVIFRLHHMHNALHKMADDRHFGNWKNLGNGTRCCYYRLILLIGRYMAHGIAAIPMTLSVLQGHSPVTYFFKCVFVQLCSSYKISTDIVRHTVPL